MARVEYSAIVDRVRGRVGTYQFRRWKSTDTLAKYRRPRDPQTAAQLRQRQLFRSAVGYWANVPLNTQFLDRGAYGPFDVWREMWRVYADRLGRADVRAEWIGAWMGTAGGWQVDDDSLVSGLPFPPGDSIGEIRSMLVEVRNPNEVSVSRINSVGRTGTTLMVVALLIVPGVLDGTRFVPNQVQELGAFQTCKPAALGNARTTFPLPVPSGSYAMLAMPIRRDNGTPDVVESSRFGQTLAVAFEVP